MHHDAVHDIESFFWVLVQICITSQGPGGLRRREFTDDPEDMTNLDQDRIDLWIAVWCLLDSDFDRLRQRKQMLFRTPENLEKDVLRHFHPYFNSLKPFISEWFSLLRIAHSFPYYEYHTIHTRVLDIFAKALQSIDTLDQLDEAGERELESRKDDVRGLAEKYTPKQPEPGTSHQPDQHQRRSNQPQPEQPGTSTQPQASASSPISSTLRPRKRQKLT